MIDEISAIVKMSPTTLMQIINLLPKNADELRMIFAREEFSLKEDEVKKILDIVAKYI
jgi:DNA-directed RNA polymerase subunit F